MGDWVEHFPEQRRACARPVGVGTAVVRVQLSTEGSVLADGDPPTYHGLGSAGRLVREPLCSDLRCLKRGVCLTGCTRRHSGAVRLSGQSADTPCAVRFAQIWGACDIRRSSLTDLLYCISTWVFSSFGNDGLIRILGKKHCRTLKGTARLWCVFAQSGRLSWVLRAAVSAPERGGGRQRAISSSAREPPASTFQLCRKDEHLPHLPWAS